MGLWIEVRCDRATSRRCYSGKNNGPMTHATHTRTEYAPQITALLATARSQGWQTRGALICPACQTDLKETT